VPFCGYSVSLGNFSSNSKRERTVGPVISIIVPVWGDDGLVAELVNSLVDAPEFCEWIVVAVRPAEVLRDLERRGVIRLISCDRPSRGKQQNLGANIARGELLCFHHADSELQPEHLAALVRAAKDREIVGGAFHRRFYPPRMLWREPLVRRINRLGGPLFGDQSLFVRRAVFREIGGFANFPLMEDIDFSRRLRHAGRIALLDPPLWSPPRKPGTWRTAIRNSTLMCLFYLGIEPRTLHRWYYGKRSGAGRTLGEAKSGSPPDSRRP
jgi:glycosyltransferase involved in cell wall biosynthesis